MEPCYDPEEGLVHKSHKPTGQTRTRREGHVTLHLRVWKCQCGGSTYEVIESTKEDQ